MFQIHSCRSSPDRGRRRTLAVAAAVLVAAPAAAPAQTVRLLPGWAPGGAVGYGALNGAYTSVDPGHPLPVARRAESFALVIANSASAPVAVAGGDYMFAQTCTAYGTATLRGRGPDGARMIPLVTASAIDAAGGSGVTLRAGAVVDVALAGTTGCNATLTRVP